MIAQLTDFLFSLSTSRIFAFQSTNIYVRFALGVKLPVGFHVNLLLSLSKFRLSSFVDAICLLVSIDHIVILRMCEPGFAWFAVHWLPSPYPLSVQFWHATVITKSKIIKSKTNRTTDGRGRRQKLSKMNRRLIDWGRYFATSKHCTIL